MANEQPNSDQIDRALRRIRQDEPSVLTTRQWRLLEYLVAEELAGRGDLIKGYSIAIDIFGRNPDFDPSHDSIVRVEMLRIRKALSQYWREHPEDDVRISFKVGSYRPIFSFHDASHSGADPGAGTTQFAGLTDWWRRPWVYAGLAIIGLAAIGALIMLQPVEADCRRPTIYVMAASEDANLDELMQRVLEVGASYSLVTYTRDPNLCPETPSFTMTVERDAPRDEYRALLRSNDTNRRIWSGVWPASVLGTDDQALMPIANSIYALSTYTGPLTQSGFDRYWSDSSARDDYRCLINGVALFYVSEQSDPDTIFPCIANRVDAGARDPDISGIYLKLYEFYSDEDFRRSAPQGRYLGPEYVSSEFADAATRQILESEPDNLFYLVYAIGVAKADSEELPNYARLEVLANQLAAAHPYNPEALYYSAIVYGPYLGRWETSLRLIDQASAIRGYPALYERLRVMAAISDRQWDHAEQIVNNPPIMEDFSTDLLIRYAIASNVGDQVMRNSAATKLIEDHDIRTRAQAEYALRVTGWDRALVAIILDNIPAELDPTIE